MGPKLVMGPGHLGTQQSKSRNGAGKVEGPLRLSS